MRRHFLKGIDRGEWHHSHRARQERDVASLPAHWAAVRNYLDGGFRMASAQHVRVLVHALLVSAAANRRFEAFVRAHDR